MTEQAEPSADWLAGQRAPMIALLETLVNIDSNSYDRDGVVAVFRQLEAFFRDQGIAVQWHEHEGRPAALSARVAGRDADAGSVLLMGHCDTVFPAGEAARRPFTVRGATAHGPGVADMKSGVVMNAYVLAAVQQAGGLAHDVVALFTCDEEIGSLDSRATIEALAQDATAVFNAEAGRPGGGAVTHRKGGLSFELRVTGKAAHSGGNFQDGASAIHDLAHKVVALSALTDLEAGLTLSVGLIKGGTAANTVAPDAECTIDLRVPTPALRDQAVARIREIADTVHVPGTRAELKLIAEFRPMVPTPASMALFEHYRNCGRQFGLDITAQYSGGCADSGFTASMGRPTVCATGPVGAHYHTLDEVTELDTMVPRARTLFAAIRTLAGAELT